MGGGVGGGLGFLLDPESSLFLQAPRESNNIKMIRVFIELSPCFDDGLVRSFRASLYICYKFVC